MSTAVLARPGRPAVIPPDLAALHGPTGGLVELPLRMFQLPDRAFNLDDPPMLWWAYTTVIREAISQAELEEWLDPDLLAEVWPRLWPPIQVREAWETAHPHLAGARAGQ